MHMFFITCKFHHVRTIMYTHWLTYNEKKTPTTTKQVKPSFSTYFVSLTAYKMIFFKVNVIYLIRKYLHLIIQFLNLVDEL